MSKTTAPAKNNAPAEVPDDDEIGEFPDGTVIASEEEDDDDDQEVTPGGKKRVSIIRRNLAELLDLPVDTTDAKVIDCVREMQRDLKEMAAQVQAANACVAKLKSIKKQLLMIAVGDQLAD